MTNPSASQFGELLRRYREAAALSQEALAERAGLSARGISDLERGLRRQPRLETIRLLADALQLSPDDRAALLAPARARDARQEPAFRVGVAGSLPVPPTRLIGCQAEIAALQAQLQQPEVRLVTITGPGGVGKTRLAIAAAAGLADAFPDGVAFVDLSPLTEPARVPSAILAALGLRPDAGDPVQRLVAALIGKRRLLVLDNCEQVVAAAPVVHALITQTSTVTVLTTSRVPLRVYGEQEFPVAPLPLPDQQRLPALAELAENPAIRLLLERAQAVQPDFVLTEQNAPAVAEICVRLDGLPLAIELAAARVKLLPPQALIARLERRLPLLTGGARTLPTRQQTMRDAIAWSYDLLADDEQRLFQRLGIFVGGAALETAATVAGDDGGDVNAGLAALVDASLLRAAEEDGEARVRMLETVREFAGERLEASGEAAMIRDRHAECFAALAAAAAPALVSATQQAMGRRLERERANLLAALDWLAQTGQTRRLLQMMTDLFWFWYLRGPFEVGLHWVMRALEDAPPDRLRLRGLFSAAGLAWAQGDHDQAQRFVEAGVALAQALQDEIGEGWIRYIEGLIGMATEQWEAAIAALRIAAARLRPANDDLLANVQCDLGATLALAGDELDEAIALAEEGRARHRAVGNRYAEGLSLSDWGLIFEQRGDLPQALARYEASLRRLAELDEAWYVTSPLAGIASIAARHGASVEAVRLLAAVDRIRRDVGSLTFAFEQARDARARATAQAALIASDFARAWSAGQALDRFAAIDAGLALAAQFSAESPSSDC